jgi:hypothetical protein
MRLLNMVNPSLFEMRDEPAPGEPDHRLEHARRLDEARRAGLDPRSLAIT